MKVDILELSTVDAEVEISGNDWNVPVTAAVSLDEGFFFQVEDAWIVLTDDYNVKVDPAFLAGLEIEQAINEAISAHRAEDRAEYEDGRGDYLMEIGRDNQ